MIREPSSVPRLCGNNGECQKLLEKNAASSIRRSRQGKDVWHLMCWESFAIIILVLGSACYYHENLFRRESLSELDETSASAVNRKNEIAVCKEPPCFELSPIHVAQNIPAFPSFLDYAHRGPLHVSYDERAIKLNGARSFFLGGSMHPARATPQTWNKALDEAVENGLNLITIYVMWSDHQPLPDKAIDWTFSDWSKPEEIVRQDNVGDKSCRDWNLANAIRSAANRGLFVHLRIGPYDCAEYSYGGIPEWLLLQKPNMKLRRPNREWLDAMESFVVQIVDYISNNRLWAHQGGNIIMAQIENELGAGDDSFERTESIGGGKDGYLYVDGRGSLVDPLKETVVGPVRKATLQDYADWCGDIAKRHAPNVTWTMCNGLSANNTIHTCNAIDEAAAWLENYGDTGRIQVDQPALLTEFEEGFQDWGETPENPNDYFWGRTASAATNSAMRWFSRGGTHLNYYMFFGAYNRGRQAAGGITNWYAADAALCPSGQRHEPKFSHYQSMHTIMASMASTLVNADTALGKASAVEVWSNDNKWVFGGKQRMFQYDDPNVQVSGKSNQVIFVENDEVHEVVVRIPIVNNPSTEYQQFTLAPQSVSLIVDGVLKFDSAVIDTQAMSYKRKFDYPYLLGWSTWPEDIGAKSGDHMTQTDSVPIEQTRLNIGSGVWSDYAWYETTLQIGTNVMDAKLFVECQRSNGLLVFVDDSFVGSTEDHSHIFEGNLTMEVKIGQLLSGQHKLSILSESLGYSNLVGRFGNSGTGAKLKGITGQVFLMHEKTDTNISLVDGREWRSFPGLHGEKDLKQNHNDFMSSDDPRPLWASALFPSPTFNPSFQSLFLQLTTGRGHFWLNGKDLGRYWNITRGDSSRFSQEYYLLPIDYLRTDGELNEIVVFDTACTSKTELEDSIKLVVSWVAPSNSPHFMDEVSYPLACI